MDLNRRSFLIGSASAVALAAAGMRAEPGLCRGILSPGHSFRRIVDLTFEVKNPRGILRPSVLQVMRAGMECPILQAFVPQPWGDYRWVAHNEDGIILLEKDSLKIVIDPPCSYASLEIISQMDPKSFDMSHAIYERLIWDNGELAQIVGPLWMEPQISAPVNWIRRLLFR